MQQAANEGSEFSVGVQPSSAYRKPNTTTPRNSPSILVTFLKDNYVFSPHAQILGMQAACPFLSIDPVLHI